MSAPAEAPTIERPGRLLARLLRQFARPHGTLGHLAGWIMAARGSNRERTQRSIELLGVLPRHRVLEIGFGPGVSIRALARAATEGQVVGIDHSDTMLAQARRRNRRGIREGRVKLRCRSVDALPPFAEPFDRILSINSIQFWPEPEVRLAELRALLSPGGRIAITLQPRQRGATSADALARGEELAAQLATAGFSGIRIETLPLEPVDAVCVLAESR